jgi:hypothetical protein
MNDLHSPRTHGGPNRLPEDLDGLLRQFFRAEMPEPWPAAPPLPQPRPRPAVSPRKRTAGRPWFRFSTRFAVAASVALLVIGYLALAGRFPTGGVSGGTAIDGTNPTADKLKPGTLPPSVRPKRIVPEKVEGNPARKMLPPLIVPGDKGGQFRIQGVTRPTPRGTAYDFSVERVAP